MGIDLTIIPGTEATIPDPPRPKRTGDTDPSRYFPARPMTRDQRMALRRAAEELSGALGGFWMHRVPGKRQAAINMDHYLTGEGQDREFSPGRVEDLFDTLTGTSSARHQSLEQGFLDKIKENLSETELGTVRRYNSLNSDVNSPNWREPWFGLSSEAGTSWYYAVGSFWLAFGGRAKREEDGVSIHYRAYIYDRYNWDVERVGSYSAGKTTFIPNEIDWLIDQDLLTDSDIPEFRSYQPDYVTAIPDDPNTDADEGGYRVNDALLGTMMEYGDAEPFDIVGSGRIRSVFMELDTGSDGAETETPPGESESR